MPDTFVRCPRCGLLVWVGRPMPVTYGVMITGPHEPIECQGVALPSKTAVCPGSGMLGQIEQLSPPKKLTELEILNQLWVDHQIQLRPVFSDGTTVILRDYGVSINQQVWTGRGWEKYSAKSYPSLQAAYADLPIILEKSGIQTTIPI